MKIKLQRKLEILNATTDSGFPFPRDRAYRDGEKILATNGWQVIAFQLTKDDFSAPEIAELPTLDEVAKSRAKHACNPAFRTVPKRIRKWLTRDAETSAADASALRKFLRAKEYLQCPCCNGSSQRPLVEGGESLWSNVNDPFEQSRVVKVADVLINANLLVAALAYLPTNGSVLLSGWNERVKGASRGRILRLSGDGWTLVQMNMLYEGDDVEVFEVAEVSQ